MNTITSPLDQIVFIIDAGAVVESRIRDLSGYIKQTTTPRGVAPVMHIRRGERYEVDGRSIDEDTRAAAQQYASDVREMDGEPGELVVVEIWELWSWGHQGNQPRMIYNHYESEEEAQTALDECFVDDFYNGNHEISWFDNRADAEAWLLENV